MKRKPSCKKRPPARSAKRWPEFAQAAHLPPDVIQRIASIHTGLATEVPAKRGKRRKLWE